MLKVKESPRSIQRAEVSWEQAKTDLKVAKSALKNQPGKCAMQSAQATINALSSVLEAHGYFQLPAFSSTELLDHCIKIDPLFEELRPVCRLLDGTIERDTFGTQRTPTMDFTPAFGRSCVKGSETALKLIKRYWKQNKHRFFSP